MDKIIVTGGKPIGGEITISGAKNAVLPIIVGTLLSNDICTLHDVPILADVETIKEVLEIIGAKVTLQGNTMTVDSRNICNYTAPYQYIQKMRASNLIMGPLLARLGRAKISMPGGCAIGTRPIDLHLKGLEALGAHITLEHGDMDARVDGRLRGARIYLDFPSVGATEHIMMAATLAEGITTIENAAEEPEIVDLANFLNSMGAKVRGAGTSIIKIEGVESLGGTTHTVIPDRIEAGSYAIAAAITGGNLLLKNVIIDHIQPVIAKLQECGAQIYEEDNNNLRVIGRLPIKAVDIKTLPYPGFPTDMQAQFMALMAVAQGTSIITETIFENRFMHVDELKRMGANIKTDGRNAIVEGVNRLTGCTVKATDLRAGAALIIAALVAEGKTEITALHHIDRGYERLIEKFTTIGADIVRISDPQ